MESETWSRLLAWLTLDFERRRLDLYFRHGQEQDRGNPGGDRDAAGVKGRKSVQDPRLRERGAGHREPGRTVGKTHRGRPAHGGQRHRGRHWKENHGIGPEGEIKVFRGIEGLKP